MDVAQDRVDHELLVGVANGLAWAPGLHEGRIGVSVDGGVVSLSGHVWTEAERTAAIEVARRVPGVATIVDELVVHVVSSPDDLDIAKEAEQALRGLDSIPEGSVRATVHDHVVVLSGRVDVDSDRVAAVRSVEGLPGVDRVTNDVDVLPSGPSISPLEVRERITAGFVRNATVDGTNVRVSIAGDEVTLYGTVSSWAERRAAEDIASATPNVRHVRNELGVDSRAR